MWRRKNLALAASERERDNDDDDEDEADLALVVRKFKKFYRNQGRYPRGGFRREAQKVSMYSCMFFECQRPGHFKADCPSLQKLKEKEKRKERFSPKKKNAYVF